MNDLLGICKTRQRPALLLQMMSSFYATRLRCDLLLVCDDDDPEGLFISSGDASCRTLVLPRLSGVQGFNAAAQLYMHSYRYIGFLADDLLFETARWDEHVLNAFKANGPGLVYADDGIQTDLPTHPFISTDVLRALGQPVLPPVNHYYWDNAIQDVLAPFNAVHRLPDVKITHRHYSVGGRAQDHNDLGVELLANQDKAAYERWRTDELARCLDVLNRRVFL